MFKSIYLSKEFPVYLIGLCLFLVILFQNMTLGNLICFASLQSFLLYTIWNNEKGSQSEGQDSEVEGDRKLVYPRVLLSLFLFYLISQITDLKSSYSSTAFNEFFASPSNLSIGLLILGGLGFVVSLMVNVPALIQLLIYNSIGLGVIFQLWSNSDPNQLVFVGQGKLFSVFYALLVTYIVYLFERLGLSNLKKSLGLGSIFLSLSYLMITCYPFINSKMEQYMNYLVSTNFSWTVVLLLALVLGFVAYYSNEELAFLELIYFIIGLKIFLTNFFPYNWALFLLYLLFEFLKGLVERHNLSLTEKMTDAGNLLLYLVLANLFAAGQLVSSILFLLSYAVIIKYYNTLLTYQKKLYLLLVGLYLIANSYYISLVLLLFIGMLIYDIIVDKALLYKKTILQILLLLPVVLKSLTWIFYNGQYPYELLKLGILIGITSLFICILNHQRQNLYGVSSHWTCFILLASMLLISKPFTPSVVLNAIQKGQEVKVTMNVVDLEAEKILGTTVKYIWSEEVVIEHPLDKEEETIPVQGKQLIVEVKQEDQVNIKRTFWIKPSDHAVMYQ
ncbi:TPA: hypothetical protein ACGO2A_000904 [Streptococcus suis]|uniref:hypothetical protein n=1 Tax=Streptococcus suis TaxID=1307 RepID=UPI000CF58676|nr:hypothetical protein [Streptococcus suis]MBY4955553.1 hypothetical protein [Streptococcus suis]MBY4970283.1 hypothetical protein [Streptococcus suis]MBY5016760.1 hypothetical protein [Streptococcus suis]NQJ69939.1 hypothetical protein [Streptococcus suis]NQJ73310.1 hypothetical protein [Streptococcus suis]